jgi:DNA-binding Lrp family transcriptional regulator
MNRINETEETRQFIGAILEEDGRARTSKIRRRTDLTEGQIHHQYRKLERHGLIEIERAEIASKSGSKMKIAVIPEDKQHMAKSLVTHDRQPERTNVDVVKLAEQVESIAESVEEIQEYVTGRLFDRMTENKERLEQLEVKSKESR